MNEDCLGKLGHVVTPYNREVDTSLMLDCMTILAKPGHMVTLTMAGGGGVCDSSPPLDCCHTNVELKMFRVPYGAWARISR